MADPFADQNKHKSRLEIWRELSKFKPPIKSRCLLLPGGHRHEIDVVLSALYPPENVYLVERNAAVLANFTRRCVGKVVPPRTNIKRMLLSQAGEQLAKSGVELDVAHLDFCSNVEGDKLMIQEIKTFIKSEVMARDSMLAITWLAGREHDVARIGGNGASIKAVGEPLTVETFNGMSFHDRGRLHRIYEAFDTSVTIQKLGRYRNANTYNPMMWGIFRVKRVGREIQQEKLSYDSLVRVGR